MIFLNNFTFLTGRSGARKLKNLIVLCIGNTNILAQELTFYDFRS